jgi:hypothetical protein
MEFHPTSSSRYMTPALSMIVTDSPPFPSILGRSPWKSQQLSDAKSLPATSVSLIRARCVGVTDELLWEDHFWRTTEERFTLEVAAYSRLRDLQGGGIPRYYAGNLRPISPHVLVLEYIAGEILNTINSRSISRSMTRSLIAIARSFTSHGVNHGDLHASNIPFSLPSNPHGLSSSTLENASSATTKCLTLSGNPQWNLRQMRRG